MRVNLKFLKSDDHMYIARVGYVFIAVYPGPDWNVIEMYVGDEMLCTQIGIYNLDDAFAAARQMAYNFVKKSFESITDAPWTHGLEEVDGPTT